MISLINKKEDIIDELISGIVKSHPTKLRKLEGFNVILKKNLTEGKVGLISGGGSGHEPAHAGFVGDGMLDAAVIGSVFSAPTPDQILAAIKSVDMGSGVLIVIKNYSGDIMNFEMAMELAEFEDIKCQSVIVNDDVAVEDSTYTSGRRGVCGTLYVHKILGQLAKEGLTLEEIKKYGDNLVKRTLSMGMSVSSCVNPTVGKYMFEMEEDEMEIGMGIHGEPGIYRTKFTSSKEVVAVLLDKIIGEIDQINDEVLVLINGLNSTTNLELYVIANDVISNLNSRNIKISDVKVGDFMTSLNMAGFSITILNATKRDIELYNQKVEVLSW